VIEGGGSMGEVWGAQVVRYVSPEGSGGGPFAELEQRWAHLERVPGVTRWVTDPEVPRSVGVLLLDGTEIDLPSGTDQGQLTAALYEQVSSPGEPGLGEPRYVSCSTVRHLFVEPTPAFPDGVYHVALQPDPFDDMRLRNEAAKTLLALSDQAGRGLMRGAHPTIELTMLTIQPDSPALRQPAFRAMMAQFDTLAGDTGLPVRLEPARLFLGRRPLE
jgi:hypothetical protein